MRKNLTKVTEIEAFPENLGPGMVRLADFAVIFSVEKNVKIQRNHHKMNSGDGNVLKFSVLVPLKYQRLVGLGKSIISWMKVSV